jgi:hypothetical protein
VIFGSERGFEGSPRFRSPCPLVPFLAGVIIKPWGAYCMVCSLEDLFCRECDVAISSILYTVINALEENVDGLCRIDWFVHSMLAWFDISWCDFTISIQEMV